MMKILLYAHSLDACAESATRRKGRCRKYDPPQAAQGKALAQVALQNPYDLEALPEEVFQIALYEYLPRTLEIVRNYFEK